LTELVWSQIENTAKDLESFAKHAGRSQISTDDVMLLARRNEGLEALLKGHVDELRAAKGGAATKGKGRKK
jgi:centromere protein S